MTSPPMLTRSDKECTRGRPHVLVPAKGTTVFIYDRGTRHRWERIFEPEEGRDGKFIRKMSFILRVGKYLVNKFWSSALNFSDWGPKYWKQKYLVWAGIWILGSMLFSLSQSKEFYLENSLYENELNQRDF